MVEVTYQHHFKFGYDYKWFTQRTARSQQWTCQYGVAKDKLSIKEANRQAALLIADRASSLNKPIFLMLSGGADSEVAARAFIDAGVPFTAAMLEYRLRATPNKIENQFELDYAKQFVQQYQLPTLVHTMDPEIFWSSAEFDEIAEISRTVSPQLAATMQFGRYLSRNHNAVVILGQGEPYLYRQFGSWWFREREMIGSWARFWRLDNIQGTSGFHQYTPEQMLAYITDPIVIELIESDIASTDQVLNNAIIKHKLYQYHYPDSNLINRKKYHGFERLFWQEWTVRDRLRLKYPFSDGVYTVEYNKMVNCLTGKELW